MFHDYRSIEAYICTIFFNALKYASELCHCDREDRPSSGWKIYKLYNYTWGDSRSGTKISRIAPRAFNNDGMTFYRASLSATVSPRESRAWEISCSAGDLTTRCKHETLADNNSSPAWIFPSLPATTRTATTKYAIVPSKLFVEWQVAAGIPVIPYSFRETRREPRQISDRNLCSTVIPSSFDAHTNVTLSYIFNEPAPVALSFVFAR